MACRTRSKRCKRQECWRASDRGPGAGGRGSDACHALGSNQPRRGYGCVRVLQSGAGGGVRLGLQTARVPTIRIDGFGWFRNIVASPAEFGFVNVTDEFLLDWSVPRAGANPAEYFFWDFVHPTTRGHRVMADIARRGLIAQDQENPVIQSVTPSRNVLWPPNHKMVPVTLEVSATDNWQVVSARIVGVTSNEPQNGAGDGNTAADWQITGDLSVELRAERSGKGPGRVYTITVEVSDWVGNTSEQSTTVTVPKK